ncbi:WD40 repeat domain-containing protein [Chloroflexota bacterium]
MKKRVLILGVAVSLVLMLAGSVVAQEDLSETYTSSDGYLTVNYPASWSAVGAKGAAMLSSGEEVINADVMPVGAAWIMILPPQILAEYEIAPDASPAEVAEGMTMLLGEEGLVTGEVSVIAAGPNELTQIPLSGDFGEGLGGSLGFSEGLLGIYAIAASGEWADQEAVILDILGSVSYAAPDLGNVPVYEQVLSPEVDSADEYPSTFGLVISPDRQYLVASGFDDAGDFVQVWDFATGELVQRINFAEDSGFDYETVTMTAANEVVVRVGDVLEFYDPASGEQVRTTSFDSASVYLMPWLTGDGSRLTLSTFDEGSLSVEEGLSLITVDAASGETMTSLAGHFEGAGISPDGQMLVVLDGNDLHVYNLMTGELGDAFYSLGDPHASPLAISNDGMLASVINFYEDSLMVIDTVTGEVLFEFTPTTDAFLTESVFSPDGKWLFVLASEDHVIVDHLLMVDVARGIQAAVVPINNGDNTVVLTFTPDGMYMAATANGTTTVWKLVE